MPRVLSHFRWGSPLVEYSGVTKSQWRLPGGLGDPVEAVVHDAVGHRRVVVGEERLEVEVGR